MRKDLKAQDNENIKGTIGVWQEKNCGKVSMLVDLGGGNYRIATPEEKTAGESDDGDLTNEIVVRAGYAYIDGMDPDLSYQLVEIEAPAGYNKLTEPVDISFAEIDEETGEPKTAEGKIVYQDTTQPVINHTGTELPETGGVGTTIFTVCGGVLMVGAAILFITRKRSAKD